MDRYNARNEPEKRLRYNTTFHDAKLQAKQVACISRDKATRCQIDATRCHLNKK